MRNPALDPSRPHGFFLEEERIASGKIAATATLLLTNKQCPWRCVMCDLWKNTLTHSVPPGAIPDQIEFALGQLPVRPEQIKLYNSGSFFDAAAIPAADYQKIAARIHFAENVVVESHPRLVGDKAVRLRDLLAGSLEVAMGLETIHPTAFPRLNKRFTLEDFAKAAEFLVSKRIAVRAFLLINPPFLNGDDETAWVIRSVQFAFDCGVTVVSLIPLRDDPVVTNIASIERAHAAALNLRGGRVFADLWDLERFSACSNCLPSRRERLHRANLTQRPQPLITCSSCDGQ